MDITVEARCRQGLCEGIALYRRIGNTVLETGLLHPLGIFGTRA